MNIFRFPVVGISHFEKDPQSLIDQVAAHPSLQLMPDNGNPYSPYTIGVYWACQQIGMVADDYARIIRRSIPHHQIIEAQFYNIDYDSHKTFWATIELEQVIVPENEIQLDMSRILDIGWPKIGSEHSLLLQNTFNQCNELRACAEQATIPADIIPLISAMCQQFCDQYGCSLSGDDRRVEMVLDWTVEDIMNSWIPKDEELAFDLYEPLYRLRDIHRHYANNPDRCTAVYNEERKCIHKALVACQWFEDYQTILEARHIALKKQQQEHERWLSELPNMVYAYYKTDLRRFCSKLFYLQLSWEQLLAVYIHLECLEFLFRLQGKHLSSLKQLKRLDSCEHNNDVILYTPHRAQKSFLYIDSRIREFVRKKQHRKTPQLAFYIVYGEHNGVFVPHMGGNAKRFITAFCDEYNIKVDYSDMKKQYDLAVVRYKQAKERLGGYVDDIFTIRNG